MSDLDDNELIATRKLNGLDDGLYESDKNVANDKDYTLAYLKGYADAEEKYRAKIKELEEYIFIAPDLDEMTAIKYVNIQREVYVRGRADEQEIAEQIIYENYIPKQKVKDKIDEINKKYEDSKDKNGESPYYYPEYTIRVLKKLLEE